MRRSLKGFTLIEMLAVVAIILILSAITLRLATYVKAKSGRTKAESQMGQVVQACHRYMADKGCYPPSQTDGYFDTTRQALSDPWNVTYRYRTFLNDGVATEFVVASFGPDMRPGIANYDDDMEDRDPVSNVRINPYAVSGADLTLWTELGYGDDIVMGDCSRKVRFPP